MAIFSRRNKDDAATAASQPTDERAEGASPVDEPDAAATAEPAAAAEPTASVGISMSSFRGLGASNAPAAAEAPSAPAPPEGTLRPPRPPAEAPAQTDTIQGLRDNVLVREALARLSADPAPEELIQVARQLLQGHLFLRVRGDARTLIAEGKDLPMGVATLNDQQYVLVYSSGSALQASVKADGDTATSAMGQPVLTVLRYALDGPYGGVIIDHASAPARAVLPRELLARLVDSADEQLTIKTLLAAERTPEVATAVAEALTTVPLWIAANKADDGRVGVAEARTAQGARYLELYTHPIEVAGTTRGDQSVQMTGAKLANALRGDEGLAGVLIDPAGPWIQLERDQLGPVLSLAD